MALPLPSPAAVTGSQDRLQATDAARDEIKESSTAEAPVVSATPPSVDRGTLASSSGGATWKLAQPQPISEAGELPEAYRSRSAAQRAAALAMGGGNGMTEAAVQAALQGTLKPATEEEFLSGGGAAPSEAEMRQYKSQHKPPAQQ